MNDLFSVVILAGGLATRLRPLTEKIPKSLVEVNGEPFISHQLRLLRENNIQKVFLCVGFLGEQISDFVGDGSRFGLQVNYLHDGPHLVGTGGAIKQALPFLEDAFFVLYGDSYLVCDYAAVQEAFKKNQKKALMTVFRNEGHWDTSNVEFENGNILAYNKKKQTEKMRYIDYGLGVLTQAAFNEIASNNVFDLADLYHLLVEQDQLAGYEVMHRFYEAGSFEGMKALENYLTHQKEKQCIS